MTVQIQPNSASVLMDDVSWDYYSRTLEELGPSRGTRITFDHGRMELRKTSALHQRKKKVIARLLETYAVEADIPVDGFGTLTLRREDLLIGLEPDECYYVQSPRLPLSEVELDFRIYPVPDLAMEAEIGASIIPKMPIYAALKVPEIWQYSAVGVMPWHRTSRGEYRRSTKSLAFPALDIMRFSRFVDDALKNEHKNVKALQDWVRGSGMGRGK